MSAGPNIVLILADDLGYGDLGCYGQQRIKTPNLDRMAAEGVRFTDFYAGSTVCAPSRCVLMTGLHTGHCFIRGNARLSLRPDDVTLAEVLKQAGYHSGLVGKWGLGQEDSDGVPTRQGFDSFFGYLDQHHAHNYYPSYLFRNERRAPLDNVVPGEGDFGQGVATKRKQYSHDLLTDEALAFLDRSAKREQPFFLYLAYTIPHANNEAGKDGMEVPDYGDYQNESWPSPEKGFAAMVSRMDRDIGRLLNRLKESGIDEKTIVFFSSDNGPHKEGGHDPEFFNSNGPLRGTKRDLYEGGIRVPMIVRWPGHAPAGEVSRHVGYFGDFLATAAEIAGAAAPEGLDSRSFVPAILDESDGQPQHEYLYWEFYEKGSAQAVRAGKWKAVVKPMHGDGVQVYDLDADIGETRNLAAEHPEIAARMHALMKQAHTPSPHWKVGGTAHNRRGALALNR